MSINIDIKKLWNKQSLEIPETKTILKKADGFRRKSLKRLLYTNILLLLTSAFIGFIWYYYQPEMVTTKIGITVMILAMIIYLAVYNLMIPLLTKTDYAVSNSEYLNRLLKIKEKQRFLQTKMLSIYYILLTSGMVLYMYEYASRMKLQWAVLAYLLTFLWIGFTWFYLRPKTIRKQDKAINDLIERFEEINKQLLQ